MIEKEDKGRRKVAARRYLEAGSHGLGGAELRVHPFNTAVP
jgi:2-keto-3-deoxy-L-rhamnonate aldolase RhmA